MLFAVSSASHGSAGAVQSGVVSGNSLMLGEAVGYSQDGPLDCEEKGQFRLNLYHISPASLACILIRETFIFFDSFKFEMISLPALVNKMVWYPSKPSKICLHSLVKTKNDPQEGPDGTCKNILNSICSHMRYQLIWRQP